jgi:hypothetical protein
MMYFYLRYFLLLAALLACMDVSAHNKVVVIPMFEDVTTIINVPLAKTGNTICSQFFEPPGDFVAVVPCSNLDNSVRGQDAELQTGADVDSRFSDNSDGTITDNVTRLVWLRDANCAQATSDWEAALGYVVELNSAGTMNSNSCADTSLDGSHQIDWRLPNIKELQSLLSYGNHSSPFVANTLGSGQWSAGDPFVNLMVDDAYWSSTTYGIILDDALRVNFDDGSLDGDSKKGIQHVWAVRSLP